ncbi:MAG: DNA-3-methyladenine glycosylase [Spirochaetales bacterium]
MKTYKITEEDLQNLIKREPLFKEYIAQFGILKKTINPNIFESIIGAMIAQQISGKAATAITNRLYEKIGAVTPQNLLALTDEDFAFIGLGPQKRGYIRSIADSFATGKITESNLKTLDDKELTEELVKLKGVGEWTAEMLLIFSVGHTNVLSYKDLGIRKGLMKLYQKGNIDEVTPAFFEDCRQKFDPYNTLASFYLWEIASLK